jgi:hypothetical protein
MTFPTKKIEAATRPMKTVECVKDLERTMKEQLRRRFEDTVHEPIPDEFLLLLARSDARRAESAVDAEKGADS